MLGHVLGTVSAPNRQFSCAHSVLAREGKRGGERAVTRCRLAPGLENGSQLVLQTGRDAATRDHPPLTYSFFSSIKPLPRWGGRAVFGLAMKTSASPLNLLSRFVPLN